MRRSTSAAGMPTALVAAVVNSRRGRRRRARRARIDVPSLDDVAKALRAAPVTLEHTLPGRGRSRLRLLRRRRRTSMTRLARHAGTAVTAVGFAADVISQMNAISEAMDRPRRSPGSDEEDGSTKEE